MRLLIISVISIIICLPVNLDEIDQGQIDVDFQDYGWPGDSNITGDIVENSKWKIEAIYTCSCENMSLKIPLFLVQFIFKY